METIKAWGLIVKQVNFDESDCIFQILTSTHGIISAMGKGARKSKGSASGCRFLSYGNFVLFQGAKFYYINGFDLQESFFTLSGDLEKLSLAAYITEVTIAIGKEGLADERLMSLILNSLYVLDKSNRHPAVVKAVFELSVAAIAGFMPNLEECTFCQSNDECCYFSIERGSIVCRGCGESKGLVPISPAVYSALMYVLSSVPSKAFGFELGEKYLEEFGLLTERYLEYHLDKHFNSLDYYKSIIL